MTTPTRKAVLAVVARRPTYGAAVVDQLRRWSVDPELIPKSSVYTALTRLEQGGLIAPRGPAPASTDRQPRMTYGATPAGEREVETWLSGRPVSYADLRLRIALARPRDLERLIGFVIEAETACLNQLAGLGAPPIEQLVARRASWEALCGAILGTMDAAELAGRAKWLESARMALMSMRDHPSKRRRAS
jgi:DNA-binding PadR family transcriptional regulator